MSVDLFEPPAKEEEAERVRGTLPATKLCQGTTVIGPQLGREETQDSHTVALALCREWSALETTDAVVCRAGQSMLTRQRI